MKVNTATSKRLDILGNGPNSDRKTPSSGLRELQQRFGYCLGFAAIPAGLAVPLAAYNTDNLKRPETNVAEQSVRPERLNVKLNSRALLKRQSAFRLPHINASWLAGFAGDDDCPGKPIPGGTYTAAAPYVDSGDTTGANDTVTRITYYYYYSFNAAGPDNVYSFVLTGRGANPLIQVSATSGTYKPMIYILGGGLGPCPAGTANTASSWWTSLAPIPGSTASIDGPPIRNLPVGSPLYLFVDSPANNANGSGPYTLRMQDVTIAPPCSNANPIDCPDFFVHQHYADFLNRQPDEGGFNAWLGVMNNCLPGDVTCLHEQRLTTSAAFFGSEEFQMKGYFVFRFYRAAFGRLPQYSEIVRDIGSVTGNTPGEVYTNKAKFADNFVQRADFTSLYSGLSNTDYVAALFNRYGVTSITTIDPAQPDGAAKVTFTQAQLVSRLDGATLSRAQVLRAVADSDQVLNTEFNGAFVAMQYFGYLRRNPEAAGYNAWLDYLNAHPDDVRMMVQGFVDSAEYRNRFGP